MTGAPGASWRSGRGPCAGPRRSKSRLRENGETTFGAVDRGASQSGRTTGEAGVSAAGSQRAQRQNELESGCRGTPQTRLLRERDRQKATVSRSVPKRGVSHRQAVISGSFPLTNRYISPGRGLNKPLYFSRNGVRPVNWRVISLGLVQADQRVSCSQERLQTHSAERSR